MSNRDMGKLAIAGVLLLAGIGLTVARSGGTSRTRGAAPPEQHYFYDLSTNELFAASAKLHPPIDAPSGGQGVRAFVYTCDGCESSELLIGYLQQLNDEAIETTKRLVDVDEQQRQALYMQIQAGTLVATEPEAGSKPQWLAFTHPGAQAVMQSYQQLCSGKLAKVCTPDHVR